MVEWLYIFGVAAALTLVSLFVFVLTAEFRRLSQLEARVKTLEKALFEKVSPNKAITIGPRDMHSGRSA